MKNVFKYCNHHYNNSAINTQVKDHISLKKNLGTVALSSIDEVLKMKKKIEKIEF